MLGIAGVWWEGREPNRHANRKNQRAWGRHRHTGGVAGNGSHPGEAGWENHNGLAVQEGPSHHSSLGMGQGEGRALQGGGARAGRGILWGWQVKGPWGRVSPTGPSQGRYP